MHLPQLLQLAAWMLENPRGSMCSSSRGSFPFPWIPPALPWKPDGLCRAAACSDESESSDDSGLALRWECPFSLPRPAPLAARPVATLEL